MRGRGFLWLGALAAAVVLVTILPFALAGITGNALWIALPVVVTVLYVLARESRRCLLYYRSLWPVLWLSSIGWALAALLCTIGIGFMLSLVPSGSPLDWSLGSLFHLSADAGVNGFVVPLSVPWLAILYAPPALLALPLFAWWEEDIFRRGTAGWRSATVRSVLFGLVHLAAGVSLGSCCALGAAGLIFSVVYWRSIGVEDLAGCRAAVSSSVRERMLPFPTGRQAYEDYAVFRATQVHMVYNVIGVSAILVLTLA